MPLLIIPIVILGIILLITIPIMLVAAAIKLFVPLMIVCFVLYILRSSRRRPGRTYRQTRRPGNHGRSDYTYSNGRKDVTGSASQQDQPKKPKEPNDHHDHQSWDDF
ncbi:hypothetical protein PQ472_08600 [Lacticaseibacillus pabuli]|uniref:Uncharacterized protein n=1 Tax=Lacticaseibacillus pabuli TaxID=3025672 RepID=A0ABY7WS77_9LACO|nr:hypothetical protein [Lacticaseibacillus sp. KACC 23028]WDF81980.1 hypothetical protein PQ472_08600 [Lacticaseibacillus sp. KACC 23028]